MQDSCPWTACRAGSRAICDRDIEILLKEQEAVTGTEAQVTGEVDVRKDAKRDTERVGDTVRRENVHVEDPNDPHVHIEGLTDAQGLRYGTMSAEERRYAETSAAVRSDATRSYELRGTGDR